MGERVGGRVIGGNSDGVEQAAAAWCGLICHSCISTDRLWDTFAPLLRYPTQFNGELLAKFLFIF